MDEKKIILMSKLAIEEKTYLKKASDPLILQMMKQVKLSLDPKNILNPNKIFD